MKKIIPILLFTIFLAACGGEETITPTRGNWNANTYTNEYLELQLTLQGNWQIYPETDLTNDISFFARQPHTESTIALTFQAIPGNSRNFSLEEFLNECGENETTHFAEHNLVALHSLIGTTPLVGMEWLTKRTEIYAPGTGIIALQFHLSNIESGYIRCIHLLVDNDNEFMEITSWFSWYRN
jgi:hypothetical protein